jgi:hypothetical protein
VQISNPYLLLFVGRLTISVPIVDLFWEIGMRTFLATLVLAISSVVALAHPGGLNKSGCHNDYVHGGYHCH